MATEDTEKKPAEWIKIISKQDGHSFILPRDVAMGSGFLRNTFDAEAGFSEVTHNTCTVDERYASIGRVFFSLMLPSAIILEKVIEYLGHKHLYGTPGNKEEIPDFQERIPPDIALEL
jgi:elongin-C